jgi:pyridoxine 4-dehydrogenase
MNDISNGGAFPLGDRVVKRLGYGAMQLAGPGVFGPPKDRDTAIAVLREAVASGVDHIDTSDFYGPHVTNRIIREALHPYSDDLVIVTKIGARRGPDASWNPAMSPDDLKSAVEDNLRNLGLDVLEVVNLRIMGAVHGPQKGRSRRRSPFWPIFSGRASCATSASATSPPIRSKRGGGSATSSACRICTMWRIARTTP